MTGLFGVYIVILTSLHVTETAPGKPSWVDECIILDDFDSDLIHPSHIKIGENVELTCKEEYFAGTTWSKCNQEGKMSTPQPPCKVVQCPIPEAVPHSRIKRNGTRTDVGLRYDEIKYICEEAYWYTGTPTRSCQRDRSWSGIKGTCEEVRCSLPASLDHGKYKESPPHRYNNTLTAECKKGYVYNGDEKRRCQQDNQWSGQEGTCINIDSIRCSSTLQNQSIIGSYNEIVDFTCGEGYIYTGTHRRTCLVNSTWSGTDGICNRVYCTKPQISIENGWIVGCDKCEYGSTLNMTCDKGYWHNGSVLVCNEDGIWNGTIGHCKELCCVSPVEIAHGRIIVHFSYKHLGEVKCEPDYRLSGDHIVHCQKDGTWFPPGSCELNVKYSLLPSAIIIGGLVLFFVLVGLYNFRNKIRSFCQRSSEGQLAEVSLEEVSRTQSNSEQSHSLLGQHRAASSGSMDS